MTREWIWGWSAWLAAPRLFAALGFQLLRETDEYFLENAPVSVPRRSLVSLGEGTSQFYLPT